MSRGFWDKLKKPIFVLAPMANVTDAAFRSIIAKYGKPDVMWTEFVSVDGLLSPGREKLMIDLKYSEAERPIVAQIFGAVPENFEKVARMLVELGFDGIDINMGCPVREVIKQSACADLIRNPTLAAEIVAATKQGAESASRRIPVSVKTRIGFGKIEIDTWIPKLLETNPAVLTVHLRTVKEMSKVPAHWELMPQIVQIVKSTPEDNRPILLGNGDVTTLSDAADKVKISGCDGVMIGRGIFGNPWLFDSTVPNISISERMRAMLEHAKLFENEFRDTKHFEVMKKHFKAYVNGFDGAKELRIKLMEAKIYQEVENIVLEHYPILKQKSLA